MSERIITTGKHKIIRAAAQLIIFVPGAILIYPKLGIEGFAGLMLLFWAHAIGSIV